MKRTRALWISVVLVAVALLSLGSQAESQSQAAKEPPMVTSSFRQMFEFSQTEKKGLVLYLNGQTLAGLVTGFSDEVVEMRSQQYDRIVVRLDRIDAMAYQ